MELQVTPTVIAYNSILSAAAKTGDLPACELFGSAATGKLPLIPPDLEERPNNEIWAGT